MWIWMSPIHKTTFGLNLFVHDNLKIQYVYSRALVACLLKKASVLSFINRYEKKFCCKSQIFISHNTGINVK